MIGTFDDVKEKLTGLYGEGETTYHTAYLYTTQAEKIVYVVEQYAITGDNGTELFLEKATYEGEGIYLMLSYGKTDSGAKIAELQRLIYQEELE